MRLVFRFIVWAVFGPVVCGAQQQKEPQKRVVVPAGQVYPATSGQQPAIEVAATESYFLWQQEGPSADVLNGEWWARAYIDAAAPVYVWAYCSATNAPQFFNCSAPVPSLPNGQHVATVTFASDVPGTTGGAVESPKSLPVTFTVQAGSPIPSAPFSVGVGP